MPWKAHPCLIASLLCLIMAALCNSVMDTLQFHYSKSVFAKAPELSQRWWNPAVSWKNKYQDRDVTRGEAFPFSSTALVGFTDAWHFFKSIMLDCIILAILFPAAQLIGLRWQGMILAFVFFKLVFGLVFECGFTLLFVY